MTSAAKRSGWGKLLNALFSPGPVLRTAAPTVGDELVYAIGDIHGRLDLLAAMIVAICEDVLASSPSRRPNLVFLGDYVDRGPKSAGVIERLIRLKRDDAFTVRLLRGNHEQQLLDFLSDPAHGLPWVSFGGGETMSSYGVRPPSAGCDMEEWDAARLALAAALTADHVEFLQSLELMLEYGDYVFVHAGLRPGVALHDNNQDDILRIRDEFLTARRPFEKVVVHGHTPESSPHLGPIRIGIDTGAYATGKLTAVRLWGESRSVLQVDVAGRLIPGSTRSWTHKL